MNEFNYKKFKLSSQISLKKISISGTIGDSLNITG